MPSQPPLQRDPPHPAVTFGEIAGHEHGGGCVEFTQHRQRVIPVVAVAVVERQAGEAPRKITLHQPPMHLVQSDDIDVLAAQVGKRGAQEVRRDFKMMVGLELGVAPRANVVQHENGADATENRPQHMVSAGQIKRFQPGADHVVAKLLHRGWFGLGMRLRS